MEVNKLVVLLIGVFLGHALSQMRNNRCGDGNKCFCSESTKIISCVDSRLVKVPAFSSYVKTWVKRLNLRFNSLLDLSSLLQNAYPRLEFVDVRDNPKYLCNDIHYLLLAKGLIIESHCDSQETTIIITRPTKTTRYTSKSPPTTPPPTDSECVCESSSTQQTFIDCDEMTTEKEKTNIIGDLNVKGNFQCECNISMTVSITAITTTLLTSIAGFIGRYLWKKFKRSRRQANMNNRFDQPGPSNYKPRIELFKDMSSVSNPIYSGPLRPSDLYSVDSSEEEDGQFEEPAYEIPMPRTRPPHIPSAPAASRETTPTVRSTQPTTSTTPPPPPPNTTQTLKKSTTIPPKRSSTMPPPVPANPPRPGRSMSAPSVGLRGRGRGRGRAISKITTVSGVVDEGPPARNTRSNTKNSKNTTFTTHM